MKYSLKRLFRLAGYPYYALVKRDLRAEIARQPTGYPILAWIEFNMDEVYWDKGLRVALAALDQEVRNLNSNLRMAAARACLVKFGEAATREHFPAEMAVFDHEDAVYNLGGIIHQQHGDLYEWPPEDLAPGEAVLFPADPDNDGWETAPLLEGTLQPSGLIRVNDTLLVQRDWVFSRRKPEEQHEDPLSGSLEGQSGVSGHPGR